MNVKIGLMPLRGDDSCTSRGTSVFRLRSNNPKVRGVCKTRNSPAPGTPRNIPGTPPEQPGTARNNPGTPLEHPIMPRNTLNTARNTLEHQK